MGFVYLNETSKPVLEILQNGDNTIDLESEDFKKYIHIQVVHIQKYFHMDGHRHVEKTAFPVEKCTE